MESGDCGVCIGDFEGESAEFGSARMVVARKPHKCGECGAVIDIRTRYELMTVYWDGRFWRDRTCETCLEIGQAMSCGDGWPRGVLWDSITEIVFPEMTTGCLDRLHTARAKETLLARWQAWKGVRR
jgi:hypothetical protein